MKFMPTIKRTKPSGVAAIRAEIDKLDADRLAAETEWAGLRDAREGVLVDGEDADLRVHDEEMARLSREAERCAARSMALQGDLAAAEAEAEQERRRKVYENAKAAQAKGRALVKSYPEKAKALAALVNQLSEAEFIVAQANKDLPDGAEPLERCEPDNGRPCIEAQYSSISRFGLDRDGNRKETVQSYVSRPSIPGVAHVPLSQRVTIPQLDPSAPRYW